MNLSTTVRLLRHRPQGAVRAAGLVLLATLLGIAPSSPLSAQPPQRHWLHAGVMPPGAIGGQRLLSSGPLSGYTQPVEVITPAGVAVSAFSGGGLTTPREGAMLAGMLVGPVYRMQATGTLDEEPIEVYPTVEVIGRLFPPPGKETEFPIPIELTREELKLAAAGSFVTRVIYVEDPATALPIEEGRRVDGRAEQFWFEARPDQDPLVVADGLGRPVAILRLGSRLPGADVSRPYCDPPIQLYEE